METSLVLIRFRVTRLIFLCRMRERDCREKGKKLKTGIAASRHPLDEPGKDVCACTFFLDRRDLCRYPLSSTPESESIQAPFRPSIVCRYPWASEARHHLAPGIDARA